MLDHLFLYELLSNCGGGIRCPRCYRHQVYADGFGMCRCQSCGRYFAISDRDYHVSASLKDVLKRLIARVRGLVRRVRGAT